MKRIVSLSILSVLVAFGLTAYLNACKPDPCVTRNVQCQNNGMCREGDCLCVSGFEGDSCQFQVNEKFESLYACIRTKLINEVLIDDNDDTLQVLKKTDRFGIRFYSIRDSINEVIDATVNGNFITIPRQEIQNNAYWGSGSLNKDVLTITLYDSTITLGDTNRAKRTYVGYKF